MLFALAIGFFLSRAVVSVATIGLFLTACIFYIKNRNIRFDKKSAETCILFSGFYLLILICSVFFGKLACLTQPLLSFGPLFLLSVSFHVFGEKLHYLKHRINIINWIFICGTLFLLAEMAYKQGINPDKIIRLAHDSKNVVNSLNIHHNIVGFMAVYAILYNAELIKKKLKLLPIFCLTTLVILIHHLGLRFALMAFYPLTLVYFLRLDTKPKVKLYGVLCGLIFAFLTVKFVPAINARYQNTVVDVERMLSHQNPNYYSLNQRFIANEIGLNIALQHWLSGVGACEIKNFVKQAYDKNSRLLIPENRKFIHNQLIYGWATFGILYLLGWFILFGYLLIRGIREQSILLEITLLFVMHQMVENTLEKQLMLMLLLYFVMVMPKGLEENRFKVESPEPDN